MLAVWTHREVSHRRALFFFVGALLVLSLFAAPLRAANVSTDKTSYLVLQPVIVTYSGMQGNSNDWISIGLASDPDGSNGLQWKYTGGNTSGTLTFDPIQSPGSYQARAYYKNGTVVQARSSFTVSYPAPVISLDKPGYLVLQKITVTYSNMPGYPKDYITIVPASAPDNNYGQYIFTNGAKSGTMTFNDVAAGSYEVRVHFNNDDNVVRARLPFTVGYPATQISTDKTSYQVLEKIVVTYFNMPGYPDDYITVVPAASPDNTFAQYFKTGGAASGAMTFDPVPPGRYEARVHYHNDDNIVRARTAFTVSNPTPQVTTDKSSYLVLEKITVNYSNMPGYQTDFVTIVAASAPDNAIGQFIYTNGNKGGTMTFNDLPPGSYEARVHFNDDNNVVYARAPLTVSYPNTTLRTSKTQYSDKEQITVTYSNMPGYARDYITVVPASSPDNYYAQWFWTNAAKNGTMIFDAVPAGEYEARAHYNNDDKVSARYAFSVTSDCAFSISPTSLTISSAAYNGSVAVTQRSGPPSCTWQASTSSTWISIASAGSGTGNGLVSYHATANPDSNSRTDIATIAGQTFTLTQSGGSQIQITSVANAASLTPALMPSGGIAQGAIFSISGTSLGPGDPTDPGTGVTAALPLGAALSNVSVQVAQGSTTMNAYPLFVWSNRVDAIMPSAMPLGNVTITVTYNGAASAPVPATVVASNFGAYATNGRSGGRAVLMVQSSPSDPGVQNSNTQTARPGQYVTLMGTGLGAINGPDNTAPPPGDLSVILQMKLLVGGKTAVPIHASRVPNQPGKDQIQFQIPSDAPMGCNTPVQVVTALTTYSNTVTAALDADGKACASVNPWSGLSEQGGRFGNIFLLQLKASAALASDQPPFEVAIDEGLAGFTREATGSGSILSLLSSIPTLGTCGSLGGSVDLSSLLGSTSSLPGMQATAYLDAGQSITVSGPNGIRQLVPANDDNGNPVIPGMYSAVLGGGLQGLFGGAAPPPFLDPGDYTVSGAGGADVGPFTVKMTIPPPITWSNKDALTTIDRNATLPFSWTAGNDAQLVLIAGLATDPNTQATSGFVCFAPGSQGNFSVPVASLANLAPTGPNGSLGALMFGTVPAGAGATFTAGGLDAGLLFYGSFTLKTVDVK